MKTPMPVFAALRAVRPTLWAAFFVCLAGLPDSPAQDGPPRDRPEPPTLTVTGRGESFAAPDSAILRLGAIAEDREAVAAQSHVNEIMQRALNALRELKIPENKISTAGVSLTAVYEQQERQPNITRPRIVGYRARNTLQIQLEDLQLVGKAIDAGVAAGANQIENLSFRLKDDQAARTTALTAAVAEARAKADTIARAMQVRIRGVREVTEGGVHVFEPAMQFGQPRMAMAADMATPIQSGEVKVEANITVRYLLDAPRPGER